MTDGTRDPPGDVDRAGLVTDAAARAARYLMGARHRAVRPDADAVARLASLRRPLPTSGESPRAQMSQRARGIEVWAMLASHGSLGLANLIDRTSAHAALFASLLAAGGAEVLAPVVINQLLVAFGGDATTDAVIAAVQSDGTCWAGGTTWQRRRAMRLSVSDIATTRDDIERSAFAILRCARSVHATNGAAP